MWSFTANVGIRLKHWYTRSCIQFYFRNLGLHSKNICCYPAWHYCCLFLKGLWWRKKCQELSQSLVLETLYTCRCTNYMKHHVCIKKSFKNLIFLSSLSSYPICLGFNGSWHQCCMCLLIQGQGTRSGIIVKGDGEPLPDVWGHSSFWILTKTPEILQPSWILTLLYH